MNIELSSILTNEAQPASRLDPIFRVAHFAAQRRIRMENENIDAGKRPWPVHDSALSRYEEDFSWAPENIRSALERMLGEQQSVVCVVFGTDDNPLQEFVEKRKVAGLPTPIVITVSLDDRRSKVQKTRDEALGRYVVSGSVGEPELYARLQDQMDTLKQQGIIDHNKADMYVSGLVGGWGDVPFLEHIDQILAYYMQDPMYFTPDEMQEIVRLRTFFQRLTRDELQKVSTAYVAWMIREAESLLSTKATVFGELPTTVDKKIRDIIPASYKDGHVTFAKNTWKNAFYLRTQ